MKKTVELDRLDPRVVDGLKSLHYPLFMKCFIITPEK
jgi:hypothetical protein